MQNRLYVGKHAWDVAASSPQELFESHGFVKQREQIEASRSVGKKFPELKGVKVTLEYHEGTGTTKNGELKSKLKVELARSMLWFACPGVECRGGDFDLTKALATGLVERRKVMMGELRCQGTWNRGDRERVACQTCFAIS